MSTWCSSNAIHFEYTCTTSPSPSSSSSLPPLVVVLLSINVTNYLFLKAGLYNHNNFKKYMDEVCIQIHHQSALNRFEIQVYKLMRLRPACRMETICSRNKGGSFVCTGRQMLSNQLPYRFLVVFKLPTPERLFALNFRQVWEGIQCCLVRRTVCIT